MEIEYKGGVAVTIKVTGGSTVVVNPKISQLGLKDIKVTDMIELVTEEKFCSGKDDQKIFIQGPGEYEVSNVSIKAISMKKYGVVDEKTTSYSLNISGTRVAILGHIDPNIDESQQEAIGVTDILIIPVGGNSITLNAHEAAKVVNHIDPKVVIPVHYADKGIKYEVTQDDLSGFLKELGASEHEAVEKLKIKNGIVPAIRTVYELHRS